MRIVFLDVDGVLNHQGCKEKLGGMYGVEDDLLDKLAEIIHSTEAQLVLTSSWKSFWDNQPINSKGIDPMARYLIERLRSRGLRLIDRTEERDPGLRGHGIKAWLRKVPGITSWIVLDDDVFPDYKECGITPRLVRTSFEHGLTDKHVDKAIKLLLGK